MALPRTGADARTPADRRAARQLHALVRTARLDAARAPARSAGARARRPLGAADRADRRRQDARGVPADTGGVERRKAEGQTRFVKQADLNRPRYSSRGRAAHALYLAAES